ncbi:AhpC/TSA family protein [Desulfatitalea sp. M08but]|uniref:AhpC/TSA family protein n=3 Tax=Desulfatitalea alkaliphila TaxID=2929485 RepID=A0AA41R345_9BACT|nr:AhpC/TSA family protein [Desulfatitalea alkaliphila]
MFARQQVADLTEIVAELDEAGVALAAIGSGTPEQAREFMAKFKFPGEMYVDPSLSVYKAFGLERGFWKTLGPASVGRGLKAMTRGFRQGGSAGDLWQQGGLFVLGPGQQLLFQHRNPAAGKQADLNAVLAAATAP